MTAHATTPPAGRGATGRRPRWAATIAGSLAVAGAALLGSTGCGADAAATADEQAFTEQWQPTEVRPGNLRLVTFNVRNFPEMPVAPDDEPPPEPLSYQRRTNIDGLAAVLVKLDFDVMGVQEIIDPALFTEVIERVNAETGRAYATVFAENANDNPQHVGIVADADRVRITAVAEHVELDLSGRLRPGLSARIVSSRPDGVDFGLMVLHLASGSSASRAALRAEQAAAAAAIIDGEITAAGDDDYLVLGDLNTAREAAEFAGLDAAFAAGTGLGRQDNRSGCTSYWIKTSSNPLVRPSWLDQIYLAAFEELDGEVPLVAGAHCAEHRCEPFESTSPQTGSTFYDVSDHCPVYFEIADRDDDAPAGGR